MNPEQVELVQHTWRQLSPRADDAARRFYTRLFALDPELRPLFRNDMREQPGKLLSMLSFAVNALAQPAILLPVVQELGRGHVGSGAREAHYATVAKALLWTLEDDLGATFTPQAREAWASTYQVLAGTMCSAAESETSVEPAAS